MRRTVTVRPIRNIRKRNMIEEQQKIIPQRRRRFLDDEVAHKELEGVLFPDILASLGAAPIELCSLPFLYVGILRASSSGRNISLAPMVTSFGFFDCL